MNDKLTVEVISDPKTLELIKQNTGVQSWHITGVVMTCSDTANMLIFADGNERFLITPERKELMYPQKPCYQTSLQECFKKRV